MKEAEARRTLGMPSRASTWCDVRAAFKRAVLQTHPDKGGHARSFAQVMVAFRLLTAQRAATSATLAASARGRGCRASAGTEAGCPAAGEGCRPEQFGGQKACSVELATLRSKPRPSSDQKSREDATAVVRPMCPSARNSSGFRGINKQFGVYSAHIVVRGLHVRVLSQKRLEDAIQSYIFLVELKDTLLRRPDVWLGSSSAEEVRQLLQGAICDAGLATCVAVDAAILRFRWLLGANRIFGRITLKRNIRVYTPFTDSIARLVEDWLRLKSCGREAHALRTALCAVWSAHQAGDNVLQRLNARLDVASAAGAGSGWAVARWEQRLKQLQTWLDLHDGFYPTHSRRGGSLKDILAVWMTKQRQRHRRGTLSRERSRLLQGLRGWDWGARELMRLTHRTWDIRLADLRAWLEVHLGQYPSRISKSLDERSLAEWVKHQKRLQLSERSCFALALWQVEMLEELPGWRWQQSKLQRTLALASCPGSGCDGETGLSRDGPPCKRLCLHGFTSAAPARSLLDDEGAVTVPGEPPAADAGSVVVGPRLLLRLRPLRH